MEKEKDIAVELGRDAAGGLGAKKYKPLVYIVAFTAALAGLLFGLDIGVISGGAGKFYRPSSSPLPRLNRSGWSARCSWEQWPEHS